MIDTTPRPFVVTLTARDLVVPAAVITSTVVLTAGTWSVIGAIALPHLRRFRNKLEDKMENTNK